MHQEAVNAPIGVLALQGGFAAHLHSLQKLKVPAIEVRYPKDLLLCRALIIPGGESTTIRIQAQRMNLLEPLVNFARLSPVFGTCAGIILMAQLGLLDITIHRNAYGRQSESFMCPISISDHELPAVFIRAPKIESTGPGVSILAWHDTDPVLVQEGQHLGATFHPELTHDLFLHRYLLSLWDASLSILLQQ